MENDSLEFQIVFPDALDCRGPLRIGAESDPENPVAEFLSKVEDEQSLLKNGGSAVLDAGWSEEVGAAPSVELSKAFLERSDARLEGVNEKLRKFFAGHPEQLEEAMSLAARLRAEVRAEIIEAA